MILKTLLNNFNKDITSNIYSFLYENLSEYKKIHKKKSKVYLFLIDFTKSRAYYENNTIKIHILLDIILLSKLIIR